MTDPVTEPMFGPTEEPPDPAEVAGLPAGWHITTGVEMVPSPVDIGQTHARISFARQTTIVTDSLGGYVASSGDRQDAINQALAICEQRQQPYDRATWPYP